MTLICPVMRRGPRRKILGLLAQQQRARAVDGGSGIAASSTENATADSSDASAVKLTPPMLESQLAKRHCIQGDNAANGDPADPQRDQDCTRADASLKSSHSESLWELASSHDASPSQYRTGLLPGEGAKPADSDDNTLAALDDLLQKSSPPVPRGAMSDAAIDLTTTSPNELPAGQHDSARGPEGMTRGAEDADRSAFAPGSQHAAAPLDGAPPLDLGSMSDGPGAAPRELQSRLQAARQKYVARFHALRAEYESEVEAIRAAHGCGHGDKKLRRASSMLREEQAPTACNSADGSDSDAGSDALQVDLPSETEPDLDAEPGAGSRELGGSPASPRPELLGAQQLAGSASLPEAVNPDAQAVAESQPDFASMDLAELKRRVKQFGLKAGGKKTMVRQLGEIWAAQHPGGAGPPPASARLPTVTAPQGAPAPAAPARESARRAPARDKRAHDDAVAQQIRAFVLSRPEWYTPVLLLDAVDMRALHAALSAAAAADSSVTKVSLQGLEKILREQCVQFQQTAPARR